MGGRKHQLLASRSQQDTQMCDQQVYSIKHLGYEKCLPSLLVLGTTEIPVRCPEVPSTLSLVFREMFLLWSDVYTESGPKLGPFVSC